MSRVGDTFHQGVRVRVRIMPILPTFILPKNILTALRRPTNQIQASPLLLEVAQSDAAGRVSPAAKRAKAA